MRVGAPVEHGDCREIHNHADRFKINCSPLSSLA